MLHNWLQFEIEFKMELNVYIQLIILCVVNIIFTFSGSVLNAMVIASFWQSSQLRKKLCYIMIMVLSCFDLASVVTNHAGLLIYLICWLREDYDSLPKVKIYLDYSITFLASSLLVLLVMNFERYLGTHYPFFHHTSVTKRRMLTILAVLLISQTILYMISRKDLVISGSLISKATGAVVFLPSLYLNFKLFKISKEIRRRKNKPSISLKGVSSCILAVTCLVVLLIPTLVYSVFSVITENKQALNRRLAFVWASTIFAMNGTFNSLIFFWKNKVLRTDAIKILKVVYHKRKLFF